MTAPKTLREMLDDGSLHPLRTREEAEAEPWWCPTCQKHLPPTAVTFHETHDPRAGGCGNAVN